MGDRLADVTKHKRKVGIYKAILITQARDFFQSKQQLWTANLQPQPAVIVLQSSRRPQRNIGICKLNRKLVPSQMNRMQM